MVSKPFATIAELWRYPVKGMRGERLSALQVNQDGVEGDRRYAVVSSGAPRGKPLLTGAERAAMLLYASTYQGDEVVVTAPTGERIALHDPALMRHMASFLPGGHGLSLSHACRPLTDVRPIALLGCGSVAQLGREMDCTVDARRFRANILLDMQEGFAEDELVGRMVRVGTHTVLRILERTPRCRMVTLDPVTAAAQPALMKQLDRAHAGRAGVYACATQGGTIRAGDAVVLEAGPSSG